MNFINSKHPAVFAIAFVVGFFAQMGLGYLVWLSHEPVWTFIYVIGSLLMPFAAGNKNALLLRVSLGFALGMEYLIYCNYPEDFAVLLLLQFIVLVEACMIYVAVLHFRPIRGGNEGA